MLNINAKILIVDDMDSLCELEQSYLNELGYYNVTACKDAESAKTLLQEALINQPFDLVLSDISMPGEDGLDFLRWIRSRKDFDRMPVIMVSAVADLDNVMKAAERGANSFIVKPLAREKLRDKLSRLS